MATFTWPSTLVPQRIVPPTLRQRLRSGGRSPTGREQRVLSDAGFWSMAYAGIWIYDRDQREAYNWALARLVQGDTVRLPLFGLDEARGARNTGAVAELGAAAALRATELTVDVTGITIVRGNWFNIGPRLHMVWDVVSAPATAPAGNPVIGGGPWLPGVPWTDEPGNGTGTYVVKITPPIRTAASSGTEVQFKNLILFGEIDDVNDGMPEFVPGGRGGVRGEASISFREAI